MVDQYEFNDPVQVTYQFNEAIYGYCFRGYLREGILRIHGLSDVLFESEQTETSSETTYLPPGDVNEIIYCYDFDNDEYTADKFSIESIVLDADLNAWSSDNYDPDGEVDSLTSKRDEYVQSQMRSQFNDWATNTDDV